MLPLENVKLIEVSTGEPAAFCAGYLGDLGAEILRAELPGKFPDYPQQVWETANRNKKSIFLNPEAKEEREVFEKILRGADVFLEDQPVGALKSQGLDYPSLRKINPRLIYCSISGYGQEGPYREIPGNEICAQALGGMLMLRDNTLANIGNPLDGRPQVPDVRVGETRAALHAAVGILAALLVRRKTGKGQYLDISLLDGVISQQAFRPMIQLAKEPMGFQVYETRDGKHIVTAAIEPWTWKNLMEKLGRGDLVDVAEKSEEERQEVIPLLRKIFRTKTRDEWLEVFREIDTELSPANSYEEVNSDPHIKFREILVEVEQPDGRKSVQHGIPMKLSMTPGRVRHPAPVRGQDTERILAEITRGGGV